MNLRRTIITACLLLLPITAFAYSGEEAYEWKFRIGPRVGATALNAEGYGRQPEFDEREWGFGFLVGAEFSWRYESTTSEYAFEFSLSPLIATRQYRGTYVFSDLDGGQQTRREETYRAFYGAAELQTVVRLSFPAASIIHPFVTVGVFSYLPFDLSAGDSKHLFFQFVSPQVGGGVHLMFDRHMFTIEAAYQRSLAPFSIDDGYENGLDAAFVALSVMF